MRCGCMSSTETDGPSPNPPAGRASDSMPASRIRSRAMTERTGNGPTRRGSKTRRDATRGPASGEVLHPRVAAMEQATPQGVKVSRQSPPHPRELGAPHGEGHLAGERRRRNRRLENPKHDRVGARNIVDARLAREAGTQPLACAGKTRTAAYRGAPTSLARRDVVCRRRPQEYLHHVFAVRAQGQGKQERSTLQVHEVRVSDPRGPERGNQPETPRTQRARRICQSAGRRGTPSRGRSPRQARIRRQRREGGNASPGGEARIRGVPRPRARPGNDRWRLRRKPVKSPI